MVILNLLWITFITVQIIDISGFINSLKSFICKRLNIHRDISIKPFDCSYCSSFWLCMIYLATTGNLTLEYISLTLLLSFLTPQIQDITRLLGDSITKIIRKLQ